MKDVSEDKLKKWYVEPSSFVEDIIGYSPYDYQKRFLDTDRDQRVFVAGRQVGKSLAISWLALHRFATRRDYNVFILSPTERQAIELFHETLKGQMDESEFDKDEEWGIVKETKSMVKGTNGSRIMSLPAANAGETIRGYTADMIIVDEAAFIEDEVFTEALGPMLMTTNAEWILASTPLGKRGFFFDKWRDQNWFGIQVSSYDNPDSDDDFIDNELASSMSEMQYKQEILGQFVESEDAFFESNNIKKNVSTVEDGPFFAGTSCYLGVDPARLGKDEAVFISIDSKGNVYDVETEAETTLPEVEQKVRDLHNLNAYEDILIDENGLGGGPLDYLKEDLSNVSGLDFTIKTKQEVYQTLKRAFEAGSITLPDNEKLRRQLREMEYEVTAAGNTKIHHPDGGHDDFPDALALATWAWKEGRPKDRMKKAYSMDDENSRRHQRGRQAYSFDN